MGFLRIILIFWTVCLFPHINRGTDIKSIPDSLIKIHGTVLDIVTKEAVQCTIKYRKLPYKENVGIAFSDSGSGEYHVHMINGRKYTIEVSANDYMTQNVDIVVDDINKDGIITKDFTLTPIMEGEIMSLNKLFFEQSKSQILEESYEELDALVNTLRNYPDMVIRLEGHTDYRGSAKLNMQLSEDRVKAVKSYLIGKGIKKRRVKVKAFGGNNPIITNGPEEARKKNRRVEVRILKI